MTRKKLIAVFAWFQLVISIAIAGAVVWCFFNSLSTLMLVNSTTIAKKDNK